MEGHSAFKHYGNQIVLEEGDFTLCDNNTQYELRCDGTSEVILFRVPTSMLKETIPTPDFLEREVFGPILHIHRYAPSDLKWVAGKLAARGYGLTLGVHSRIEAFAAEVVDLVPAGNVYVNRSITGAVVGVQPFGGEGLSGTGPKAGGPNSLIRYAAEKAISINIAAQGGDPALLNL